MAKIAIADDNKHVVAMVKEKLSEYDEITLTLTAENGRALLNALKAEDEVDLVLLDIEMPILNGLDTIILLRQLYPQIKILMHTVYDDDRYIFEAFKNGADSYILKDAAADKLYEAIIDTLNGGAAMSPTIALKTIQFFRATSIEQDNSLSKREAEIVQYISKGRTNREVADALFISPFTVKRHIENIYEKLRARNRIQLLEIAKKKGLL